MIRVHDINRLFPPIPSESRAKQDLRDCIRIGERIAPDDPGLRCVQVMHRRIPRVTKWRFLNVDLRGDGRDQIRVFGDVNEIESVFAV
jgi:hypothetical protein